MTDEKRKRGRPRVETPGVRVTTWIREPDYERILKQANRDDQSLSGKIRDLLTRPKGLST